MTRAYISHGVENPALYRLMFGGYLSLADAGRPPIERAAAEEAKALLGNAIVDGALRQPIPQTARNKGKLNGAILACWSILHGLTLLLADGLVGPREKHEALCDSLMHALLHGLIDSVPSMAPGIWLGPPTTSP
jgi:hypothetical protein